MAHRRRNSEGESTGPTKVIKDAHGLDSEVSADHGTGPEHLKDKHPHGVNTGRKDAHGNEIWETPEEKSEE